MALVRSLADQLRDPNSNGSRYFTDWFVRAALDDASPHHEAVLGWYEAILTDDRPASQVLRACLQPLVDGGRASVERHPCLATLGTELVIALANGYLSGVAEIRITPLWIEVRRSDRPLVPAEFSYDEISYDHFSAMGDRRLDE